MKTPHFHRTQDCSQKEELSVSVQESKSIQYWLKRSTSVTTTGKLDSPRILGKATRLFWTDPCFFVLPQRSLPLRITGGLHEISLKEWTAVQGCEHKRIYAGVTARSIGEHRLHPPGKFDLKRKLLLRWTTRRGSTLRRKRTMLQKNWR